MSTFDIESFITIYNDVKSYPTIGNVADKAGISHSQVRRRAASLRAQGMKLVDRTKAVNQFVAAKNAENPEILDEETTIQNIRLAKQLQKTQDISRVKDKAFREHVRIDNTLTTLTEELIKLTKEHSLTKQTKFHQNVQDGGVGIIHWSDQHMNEMVELTHNQYNWTIAAARLRKHVMYTKKFAKAFGIKTLLVAMTGDLLNSDRRLDEMLSNSTNRSNAAFLAANIYSQALIDLNQDFNLTVASVTGNEGRVHEEPGWVNSVATDNYDTTIYNMLRLRFHGSKGIHFTDNSDSIECVVKVGTQNVLLIHGHGAIAKNTPAKSVQELKGRYIARGVKIDMVIWGHVHEAMIADMYARSSSLVGSNDYSEKSLNLSGRASQNFYILNEDGGFHGIKIDLQDTTGVQGYNIDNLLASYNTKSHLKLQKPVVIHQVVV